MMTTNYLKIYFLSLFLLSVFFVEGSARKSINCTVFHDNLASQGTITISYDSISSSIDSITIVDDISSMLFYPKENRLISTIDSIHVKIIFEPDSGIIKICQSYSNFSFGSPSTFCSLKNTVLEKKTLKLRFISMLTKTPPKCGVEAWAVLLYFENIETKERLKLIKRCPNEELKDLKEGDTYSVSTLNYNNYPVEDYLAENGQLISDMDINGYIKDKINHIP